MTETNNNTSLEQPQPIDTLRVVDPFPTDFGPKPPEGFTPRKDEALVRLRAPTHAQLVAAPDVIDQIHRDPGYSKRFGTGVPDGSNLADMLMQACGWSKTVRNVLAYLAYARFEERRAWMATWPLLDTLQPVFLAVLAADPSLRVLYPALVEFFSIRKAYARRAVATLAAKRAEEAKKAQAAQGSPAASSPANNDNASNHGGGVTSTTQK